MKNFDYYHRKSIQVAEKLSTISATALFIMFGAMVAYHLLIA
jgi:hypothetical protein